MEGRLPHNASHVNEYVNDFLPFCLSTSVSILGSGRVVYCGFPQDVIIHMNTSFILSKKGIAEVFPSQRTPVSYPAPEILKKKLFRWSESLERPLGHILLGSNKTKPATVFKETVTRPGLAAMWWEATRWTTAVGEIPRPNVSPGEGNTKKHTLMDLGSRGHEPPLSW